MAFAIHINKKQKATSIWEDNGEIQNCLEKMKKYLEKPSPIQ